MKAQSFILILSDGTEVKATVPEFCNPGSTIQLVKIKVGEPFDLPPDCKFMELEK